MKENLLVTVVITIFALYLVYKGYRRLQLSFAKHPSLRGHAKWSRRIARLVPYFEYSAEEFFCTDGAPYSVAKKRQKGFNALLTKTAGQSPKSIEQSSVMEKSISDVQFTSAYRIPFPYRKQVSEILKAVPIVDETKGTQIKDIDGNWRYDLSGSYGVNVFGYDFYKQCLERGYRQATKLGPVLGPYHPVIAENVEKLKTVSGLDEVSFHMSGTEAVMQAVRLARYHTGRSHLVRLCGAYHGWWDGVQPGVGNQRKVGDVYTLNDLSERTLTVLKTRKDIACVLINPLQAMHPNADSGSDASLVASTRNSHFDRERYTQWLHKIRQLCSERNIVLIFDEVFTGFRFGYRGAQEYFGIQADMVTYGKTVGGGLPVGVVCGRHDLMKRFRDNAPADISFARGTFNSHPYLMTSMNTFLNTIEEEHYQQLYHEADATWNRRTVSFNEKLQQAGLPLKIVNMQSVLSVHYTLPSRYNWMLQFYLRSSGLELSWIGSARFIMSLNFNDTEFDDVVERFISAALQMQEDGWWWQSPALSNASIKRQMATEMVLARLPFLKHFIKSPRTACSDRVEIKAEQPSPGRSAHGTQQTEISPVRSENHG